YWTLPIPRNSLGLRVSTRLVPSAFGFLGHASAVAQADPLVTAREMNRKKNPAKRLRELARISISTSQSEGLLMHSKMRPVWARKSGVCFPPKKTFREATTAGNEIIRGSVVVENSVRANPG